MQKHGAAEVKAVTFDYGQRHAAEIVSARKIADLAGIAYHEVISVQNTLAGASPLVNRAAKVESYTSAETLPGGLEKTFVPMRNTLFLTIAANRAVAWGMGEKHIELYTGVGQEDYGGYPDCRKSFIDGIEYAFNQSLDDPNLPTLHIITPLMHLSKAETVQLSESIPGCHALLAWSHTCYNGAVPPCGFCHACLLRAKGYAAAGVSDPLLDRLAA
jgi:7-cyano-7-deazaguanine synthase